MNQLRSLPAAEAGAAGTGKALPSQRGDGDSCSAFQLYSLLFGAASPAGYTLHWGKLGFAMGGWKSWEAAPSRGGCCLADAYFTQTQQPHRSTVITTLWGKEPAHSGTIFNWLGSEPLNSFWALWLFLECLKTTYCQIMVRSSCSCRKKKGERKGSTATSQATSALRAVRSQINAEGMTATISVNCCTEGAV